MQSTGWIIRAKIKLLSCSPLHGLECQWDCMLFSSIRPMKGQFILMEMRLMKTSPQLIEAKLALMNQYLACALCMRLLGVACFCEHHRLKRSMIRFVLGFFMLARLSEPLNIFHQCIAFCYSSSWAQFLPCQIDWGMVRPFFKYKFTRMFNPRTSGWPSGLGILRKASTSPTAGM